MQPFLENVPRKAGSSIYKLNRRLENGIPFVWHHHPELELTLTFNCTGQRFVGDSAQDFEDGDLVLVGPNLPHSWVAKTRIDNDIPFTALVIWFEKQWLEQIATSTPELKPILKLADKMQNGIKFSSDVSGKVRPIFEQVFQKTSQGSMLSFLEIMLLLSEDANMQILATSQVSNHGTNSSAQLDRVLSHIHENYAQPLRMKQLAQIAALSLSGLDRLFQKHTKTTISDYLINLRIGDASAQLATTSAPVQTIAHNVGYNSLANFNRHFKRLRGVTPRQYRATFGVR
ncbi:helix-turn-helix domain-containing protein [Maritalea sp.]|uniref:helix-turn-helix domain-containing protein n=1 Tax=Maritalea sp. TaxID=2003361 RepID=UPI003EF13E0E